MIATLIAAALIAAASPVPSPAGSPAAAAAAPAPSPGVTLSVVCQRAPLFTFPRDSNLPARADTPPATLGQRFTLMSGPRTTLEGSQYYETDIVVVDPGYPANSHYWINRNCAIPSK
jgi:hypothetical protein